MSNYNYFNYLKKYSPDFLLKYESWSHRMIGRGSGIKMLTNMRAALMLTPRVFILPGLRTKSLVYYFMAGYALALVYGIWYFQEIYNKFTIHKWIHYMPMYNKEINNYAAVKFDVTEEKKPITRVKYQDKIKIIYDGDDTIDPKSPRRFRYR